MFYLKCRYSKYKWVDNAHIAIDALGAGVNNINIAQVAPQAADAAIFEQHRNIFKGYDNAGNLDYKSVLDFVIRKHIPNNKITQVVNAYVAIYNPQHLAAPLNNLPTGSDTMTILTGAPAYLRSIWHYFSNASYDQIKIDFPDKTLAQWGAIFPQV